MHIFEAVSEQPRPRCTRSPCGVRAPDSLSPVRRKDMASLQKRTGTLDLAQPCARCQQPLSGPPPPAAGPRGGALPQLYLFPTGNAFHGACAAAEVASLVIPAQAGRIRELVAQLAQVRPRAGRLPERLLRDRPNV